MDTPSRSRTNVVLIGRVDHGKSTVLGRLLFELGVVSTDRYENVRLECERSGRPFEYAFLLDALREERKQGITIDAARAVLRLERREFLFFDAPGHVEFTRNLASGATHAEACLMVIDAEEGATSTLDDHAQIVSLLALKNVIVVINKIDLVQYSEERINSLSEQVSAQLAARGVSVSCVVPVSGMFGDNIASRSLSTAWYIGPTLREAIEAIPEFDVSSSLPFRMYVQDVYKSPGSNDSKRIVAGTVASGEIAAGATVFVFPSGATTTVRSVERYPDGNVKQAGVDDAIGLVFSDPIYVGRGDLICTEPTAHASTRLTALVLWLSREPLRVGDDLQVSIGTKEVVGRVIAVTKSAGVDEVAQREFATIDIETMSEVAFDESTENTKTSTIALARQNRIQGFGRILRAGADTFQRMRDARRKRQSKWEHSLVSSAARAERYMQRPALMVLTGGAAEDRKALAKILEAKLFTEGRFVYYLGFGSFLHGLADSAHCEDDERMRRFGELTHVLLDSGAIVIATVGKFLASDMEVLRIGVEPFELIVVDVGPQPEESIRADVVLGASSDMSARIERLKNALIERGALFRPW